MVVAIALIAIVALIAWLLRGGSEDAASGNVARPAPTEPTSEAQPAFSARESESAASSMALATAEPEPAAPQTVSTGRLIVIVTWTDGSPATGIWVRAFDWNRSDVFLRPGSGVTDAAGQCVFEDLLPGKVGVGLDRAEGGVAVLRAGETAELRLVIPAGLLVRGLVVTQAGHAAAGAAIQLTQMSEGDPPAVAVSDAAGRFELRDCGDTGAMVGATLEGHIPSSRVRLRDSGTHVFEVTLTLGGTGGAVAGHVRDAKGAAIAGALLEVSGYSWRKTEAGSILLEEGPMGRRIRADEHGAFEAHDLPIGKAELAARSRGHTPWRGSIELEAGKTTTVDVTLSDSAVVSGIVTDVAGQPVKGARIETLYMGQFLEATAVSGADGSYELVDVPLEITPQLVASQFGVGRDQTALGLQPGVRVVWNPRLDPGPTIAGRVVDMNDVPLAGVHIWTLGRPPGKPEVVAQDDTDAQGRFRMINCADAPNTVTVNSVDWRTVLGIVNDVRPGPSELLVRVNAAEPTAWITGRLELAQGGVPASTIVRVLGVESKEGPSPAALLPDGGFRVGPLKPGTWELFVIAAGRPEWRVRRVTLASDETQDLGLLILPEPGRIVLQIALPPNVEPGQVQCRTGSDADSAMLEPVDGSPGSWESGPLVPGDYVVSIRGYASKVSAPLVPAQLAARVEPGQTTSLSFVAETGISVHLRVTTSRSEPPPMQVGVKDARGVEVLSEALAWRPRHESYFATATLVLKPGPHSLAVSSEGKTLVERPLDVPVEGTPSMEVDVP